MPRPSLKTERTEQIVDAAMQCVAQFGVRGMTLEQVADHANLARPLIRHNIGNKEKLVDAVVDRYLESSKRGLAELLSSQGNDLSLYQLVEVLFDDSTEDTTLLLVAEALIAESAQNPRIATIMKTWLEDFIVEILTIVGNELPHLDKKNARALATGITGIYFTVDSMKPLGKMSEFSESSKTAAKALINHYAES